MAAWLSKLIGALTGRSTRDSVLQALRAAQRSRLKVHLQLNSGHSSSLMVTVIEQVGEEDLIISQPTVGGLTQTLAFGEPLTISFTLDSRYHTGRTHCMGRARVPAGAAQTLFAYRLELPESLRIEPRPSEPRAQLTLEAAPEARLYVPGSENALLGQMCDISATGTRVRVVTPGRTPQPGEFVYLKAALPEPVGLIDETVSVVRLDQDRATGQVCVSVQFTRPIPGLADLMRKLESTAATRRHAA